MLNWIIPFDFQTCSIISIYAFLEIRNPKVKKLNELHRITHAMKMFHIHHDCEISPNHWTKTCAFCDITRKNNCEGVRTCEGKN